MPLLAGFGISALQRERRSSDAEGRWGEPIKIVQKEPQTACGRKKLDAEGFRNRTSSVLDLLRHLAKNFGAYLGR